MSRVNVQVKLLLNDNTIDLSLSDLSEVPVNEIAPHKRVTVIDLSNNKLFSLGKTFTSLVFITKLDLSKNCIKYLPDDFGKLRNLRHLDLYSNQLERLPLSFGDLYNLRYLDLKDNPLVNRLREVVGPCLTSQECIDSAKNTVRFLAEWRMRIEREAADKEKLRAIAEENNTDLKKVENSKPKKNKKNKNKSKKNKSENAASSNSTSQLKSINSKSNAQNSNSEKKGKKSNTALKTVLVFFLLLAINIVMIYIATVKNNEFAEQLVEFIPSQYRDFILSKTEIVRLHVSDWIEQFRTPPEQN